MSNRSNFIGGSDAAAVLGVSHWTTPYALWEEKVYGIVDETNEDRERSFRWGKRLEPIVIQMLEEEYGVTVLNRNGIYVDREYGFLRAEVDFEYVLDPTQEVNHGDGVWSPNVGTGDVKTVHSFAAGDWGETGTDEVPTYYLAQFQHGMMVTGAAVCMVVALIGSNELRIYYVRRDEEIIAFLRQKELEFWNKHVLAKVPPPLKDASDAKKMLAKFDGVTVQATEQTKVAIRQLVGVKAAQKRLEAKRDSLEDALKIEIATGITSGEQTPGNTAIVDAAGKPLVTWGEQTCRRISIALVKENYPTVAQSCTTESTTRVMRIKERNL